MILNEYTLDILKNFAQINKSIFVKAGNVIRTINTTSSIMAESTLDQSFPKDFAIYDLNIFLSSYSNFNEPKITFNEQNLIVQETYKNQFGSMKFWYTDPENLITVSKMPKMPSEDIIFTLTDNEYSKLKRFHASLQLSTVNGASIIIKGNSDELLISVSEKNNVTSNLYEIPVSPTKTSGTYTFILQSDNMNFLKGSYEVTISKKNIARFNHLEKNLVYYVGLEPDSEYKE